MCDFRILQVKLNYPAISFQIKLLSMASLPTETIVCVCSDLVVEGMSRKMYSVTGRGGPNGSDKSRLLYFLGNRLRVGGEVVSFARRPPVTPPPPPPQEWW
jgi:hypothetical protein